jgi:hypothetical protein
MFPREPKFPVKGIEAPSSMNSGAGGFGASVAGASVAAGALVAGTAVGSGASVGAGAQLAISILVKSTIANKLISLVFILVLHGVLNCSWTDACLDFDITSITPLLSLAWSQFRNLLTFLSGNLYRIRL